MYYDVGMYSGIWTRNFVYLVRWHGQLMSALAGHCSPYKKRRANKDQLGRHQLTTPSSKVKKNPCSYSAIEIYSKLSGWHGRYVYCIFIDITINLTRHTKYIYLGIYLQPFHHFQFKDMYDSLWKIWLSMWLNA